VAETFVVHVEGFQQALDRCQLVARIEDLEQLGSRHPVMGAQKRLHRPWKVPIHMPRVLIGNIADRRVSISLAALLVKVTARMPWGLQ
jgi:hypothetical protein